MSFCVLIKVQRVSILCLLDMMKLRTLCLLALSCVAKLAAAKAAYGSSKLLVVTDGKDVQKDDYTKFWGSLRGRLYFEFP